MKENIVQKIPEPKGNPPQAFLEYMKKPEGILVLGFQDIKELSKTRMRIVRYLDKKYGLKWKTFLAIRIRGFQSASPQLYIKHNQKNGEMTA